MSAVESYRKLAQKTVPPADQSELFLSILKEAMEPEEAEFLAAMPAPRVELAAKFSMTEDAVDRQIQEFMRRGFVVPTKEGHRFLAEIALLRDEMLASNAEYITPELVRLWKEYYDGKLKQELVDWFVTTDPKMLRIIPAQKAVPKGVELYPWEDINKIIEHHAESATVRDCCCRVMVEACDLPQHVCVQFGGRADYAVNRGAAPKVDVEEVKKIALEAEEAGLVPMVANIAAMTPLEYLCYCCGCCCVVIDPLKQQGKLLEGLAKSRFEAIVDQNACTGCQQCVKRCQFDAISLVKVEGAKALKAQVDPEKCWGCGACVLKCKPQSLTLKVVRGPEYVPEKNPYLIL